MMTESRRKEPRIAWSVPATYQVGKEGSKGRRRVRTLDVSDSGALLEVDENLAPGTRIELKFQIDDFEVGPEPARVLRNDSAFQGSELLMAVQLERPHSGLAKAVEFDREKKRWHNSKLLGKRL